MMSVANNALGQARLKAFQQGLEKLGWTDGRNTAIEVRWSEGRIERYAEFTSEFVRLKVDGNPSNGAQVVRLEIRRADEIASALETLTGPELALYVVIDSVTNANRLRINTLALGARLPTMHGTREQLEAGGLMSYGADFLDLYRRAAGPVDKILRGTKPDDIPVEQPTKFDLVINLTTAKALGITVPPSLLARADEMIE